MNLGDTLLSFSTCSNFKLYPGRYKRHVAETCAPPSSPEVPALVSPAILWAQQNHALHLQRGQAAGGLSSACDLECLLWAVCALFRLSFCGFLLSRVYPLTFWLWLPRTLSTGSGRLLVPVFGPRESWMSPHSGRARYKQTRSSLFSSQCRLSSPLSACFQCL